jgi:mRNA-degrading endonuclease RelE of RelBE toxin-antitoxin system
MKLVPSPRFRKSLRRLDPQIQRRVRAKLKLFLENKYHPSLRYKHHSQSRRQPRPRPCVS